MPDRMHTLAVILAVIFWNPFLAGTSLYAHHGTGISYDDENEWTGEVVVRSFNYINPHPTMTFDVIDEAGSVEHWVSELNTNPARMLRAGWGRGRTIQAMEPGTKVILTVSPSRAGGNSGLVTRIMTLDGVEVAQR